MLQSHYNDDRDNFTKRNVINCQITSVTVEQTFPFFRSLRHKLDRFSVKRPKVFKFITTIRKR